MLGNNAESTGEISGKRLGNADIQIEITLALATACLGEEPQLILIEVLVLDVPHLAWAEQLLKLTGSTVAEVLPMLRRLQRGLRAEEATFGEQLGQLLELMGPGMLSHVFEAQAIASSG